MSGGDEQWYRMFGRYPSGRKIEGQEGCGSVLLKGFVFAFVVVCVVGVIIEWLK